MSLLPPGSPTIFNVTLTPADTEIDQVLPANTKAMTIQARTDADVKLSWVDGESGTTFITIKSGAVYFNEILNTVSTVHLQSPTDNTVVEIETWSGGS